MLDKTSLSEVCRAVPDEQGRAVGERLRGVAVCEGAVSLRVSDDTMTRGDAEQLLSRTRDAVTRSFPGTPLTSLAIDVLSGSGDLRHSVSQVSAGGPKGGGGETALRPSPSGAPEAAQPAPCIIAVGAGKGGVGKSTVAVNLGVGLARRGHTVGLLDGDIYGPSLPTMLGLGALDQAVIAGRLQPFLVHGVRAVTMGKLVEPGQPMIWRGPMAHRAFRQLVEQTEWGELDYLVIDLPPGTGDVVLTMAQVLQLTGAVVVCTPQKVAQDDASRAIGMFEQLSVPVLGVVENMSYFVGDDGKTYDIFGRGGAMALAQRRGVPFLGSIPITMSLRETGDSGLPVENFTPGPLADALNSMVDHVLKQAALAGLAARQQRPKLTVTS